MFSGFRLDPEHFEELIVRIAEYWIPRCVENDESLPDGFLAVLTRAYIDLTISPMIFQNILRQISESKVPFETGSTGFRFLVERTIQPAPYTIVGGSQFSERVKPALPEAAEAEILAEENLSLIVDILTYKPVEFDENLLEFDSTEPLDINSLTTIEWLHNALVRSDKTMPSILPEDNDTVDMSDLSCSFTDVFHVEFDAQISSLVRIYLRILLNSFSMGLSSAQISKGVSVLLDAAETIPRLKKHNHFLLTLCKLHSLLMVFFLRSETVQLEIEDILKVTKMCVIIICLIFSIVEELL